MRRKVGKSLETREVEKMIREGSEGDALALREALDLGSPRGRDGFLRDVAAFANSAGGHVAIGINRFGQPVGLSDELDESGLNRLASSFFGRKFGLQYIRHVLSDETTVGWLFVPSQLQGVVVVPLGASSGRLTDAGGAGLAPGDVYVRRDGESVRAGAADLSGIVSKIVSGRGYVLVAPPRAYKKELKEPVVKPPDLGKVLQAVRATRRTESLEFRDRIDLDSPREAAGLVRDMAAFANARGGYIALGTGTATGRGLAGSSDLAPLRELAEAYLRAPLELDYTEVDVPGRGTVGLIWVPAVDRIAALEKPFVYEEATGQAVTALREGDVYFREGPANVLAESRHYDLMMKKIVGAKDYRLQGYDGSSGSVF